MVGSGLADAFWERLMSGEMIGEEGVWRAVARRKGGEVPRQRGEVGLQIGKP